MDSNVRLGRAPKDVSKKLLHKWQMIYVFLYHCSWVPKTINQLW